MTNYRAVFGMMLFAAACSCQPVSAQSPGSGPSGTALMCDTGWSLDLSKVTGFSFSGPYSTECPALSPDSLVIWRQTSWRTADWDLWRTWPLQRRGAWIQKEWLSMVSRRSRWLGNAKARWTAADWSVFRGWDPDQQRDWVDYHYGQALWAFKASGLWKKQVDGETPAEKAAFTSSSSEEKRTRLIAFWQAQYQATSDRYEQLATLLADAVLARFEAESAQLSKPTGPGFVSGYEAPVVQNYAISAENMPVLLPPAETRQEEHQNAWQRGAETASHLIENNHHIEELLPEGAAGFVAPVVAGLVVSLRAEPTSTMGDKPGIHPSRPESIQARKGSDIGPTR